MANDPLSLVFQALLASSLFMLMLWLVQRTQRNASLADVGWCVALAGVVGWYAWAASGDPNRRLLVAVMAAIYAGRLGGYLLLNRVLGKREDARYQALRRDWGAQEQSRMCLYFQLQALAVAAFSIPFLVVMQNPRPTFSLWELVGWLVWLVAVSGEALADWQLAEFRNKSWNGDRVCQAGLWRYSRHPNYFFEWLHWWAYVVMALGLPAWGLTLIGPVVMGWALLKLTGIPLAEAQALETRGEEYRAYQRTTSSFIPWFPKSR